MRDRASNGMVAFAGLCAAVMCAASASARQDTTDASRLVRVALSDEAHTEVLVAVSGGAVEIDGWRYKALYRGKNGAPEVIGFFAARVVQGASIAPIGAVWYRAPELPSGAWSSEAFPELSPSTAAAILKARFQIPDAQDVLWDVGELSIADASCATDHAEPVVDGLLASDPLGAVLAPLAPESKSVMLSALADIGYPAVDAKPEAVEESERFHMLDVLQSVFQDWLSTWVPMPGAEHLLIESSLPQEIDVVAVSGLWSGPVSTGCPPAFHTPWTPIGPMCDCQTVGPRKHCVEVKFGIGGEIDISIPWPPPTGTRIRIAGAVDVKSAVMVCGWKRSCMARMTRQFVQFIPPNCELRETSQTRDLRVERWDWWPYELNPTCAEMSCLDVPPTGMPPQSEYCGMGDEVITWPPPQ